MFAEFQREILRERVRAGLADAKRNGQRLGRPMTAGLQADKVRKLHGAGVSKAEIARRLRIGRTSVRRILANLFPEKPSSVPGSLKPRQNGCRCCNLIRCSGGPSKKDA